MWIPFGKYSAIFGVLFSGIHYGSYAYVSAAHYVKSSVVATAQATVADAAQSLGYQPKQEAVPELTILDYADREALRWGLNRFLVRAVLHVESRQNPYAVSPVGAIGVMQVMPANAKPCGLKHYGELFDYKKNISCGVQLLADQMKVHKDDVFTALMGYNCSPAAVKVRKEACQVYAKDVLAHFGRDISA